MPIMTKFFLILVTILPFLDTHCLASRYKQIRDFRTPRLMALGGAGRGAILLDESLILNPASVSFYKGGAIFYQKGDIDLQEPQGTLRNSLQDSFLENAGNQAAIVSDASGARLKGSLGFKEQYEFQAKRKTFSSAAAAAVSEKSSIGFLVSYIEEKTHRTTTMPQEKDYWQGSLGPLTY